MKILCVVLLCLISDIILSQESVSGTGRANRFSLNGYVMDNLSGESIIGATIAVNGQSRGVLSNQYGFYSITLDSGIYTILSWDKTYCYNLFMNSKGSIIATAAKKGQFAYANTDVGGYFTSNFVTALEKYLSKFQAKSPTWEEIITEKQETTVTQNMLNICTKNTTCRQDPVFAVNAAK
jgi:hypothetical protein